MKLVVFLALISSSAGCKKDEPALAPPPPPDPNAQNYRDLERDARDGELGSMLLDYSVLPIAERAKKEAPVVGPAVIANWNKIRERGLEMAQYAGLYRARGKRDTTAGVTDMITMFDELSAVAPDVAAKWSPLKTELVALEQTAYTEEHDDKRPRITVWTPVSDGHSSDEMLGVDAMDCVEAALQKKWPAFKFVPEYHPVDGPSIELASLAKDDEYRSTTGETMHMAAGGAVELRAHELPKALAKAFTTSVIAMASVGNPSQIKSDLPIGGTPVMELSRAGQRAIESTREQLCENVTKELAAR